MTTLDHVILLMILAVLLVSCCGLLVMCIGMALEEWNKRK